MTRTLDIQKQVLALSPVQACKRLVSKTQELLQRLQKPRLWDANFLLQLSSHLSQTNDFSERLDRLATMLVPRFAEWCSIDLLDDNGSLVRHCLRHTDAVKSFNMEAQRARRILSLQSPCGSARVIKTMSTLFCDSVDDNSLHDLAIDEEQYLELKRLKLSSYVCVPLIVHGKAIGALGLGRSDSTGQFEEEDFWAIEKIAYHCSPLFDQARRFTDAERLNRLKDDFLATLSHELRTPLSAIIGWTDLILRETEQVPSFIREGLEAIAVNSRAELTLVEELLDSSRILSGKMHLELGAVDLCNVLTESLHALASIANPKKLRISAHLPKTACYVRGDTSRLRQVFWNLLVNAAKFSHEDGQIEVELRYSGGQFVVEVKDYGHGIEPALLPHVFERFRQSERDCREKRCGLGLGLYISRQIVELHHGSVGVHSDGLGLGASFFVTLPALNQDQLARTNEASKSLVQELPAQMTNLGNLAVLKGLSVFLIEDTPDIRKVVARMLKKHGADVTEFESSENVLTKMSEKPCDLLICDIELPGESGLSFIRRFRHAGGPHSSIHAIAMSASVREDEKRLASECGFSSFLEKPITERSLVETIARLYSLH